MSRIFEERLVAEVKKYPVLYDKSNKAYRKRMKRRRVWLEVSKGVGASVEDCQNRWKSLRDRFVKENEKNPSFEKWKFYNTMLFLKDYVSSQPNKGNRSYRLIDEMPIPLSSSTLQFPSETSVSHNTTFQETSVVDHQSSSKMHRDDECLIGIVQELIKRNKPKINRNQNQDFFRMLDGYLIKLNDDQQDTLKLEMLNFIHKRSLELKNTTIIEYE